MKESGAAVMQKNEKVKNLWKLVTVLGAALIALYRFLFLPTGAAGEVCSGQDGFF